MSHMHIPDGVLPWWLWLGGWLITTILLGVASRRATRTGSRRAVPLIGAVAALVLVSMSSEIVPIAYHVNLTVVAGVMLGPWLGMIAAFIVVLVLALLGHGGVTVVGLNALVIGTEIALGWALVRGGTRLAGLQRIRPVAAVATVVTLAITTTLLVGVVAVAGTPAASRESGALDTETLEFRDPFSEGVFHLGLLGGDDHGDTDGVASAPPEGEEPTVRADETLAVARFATVVYTLGPIGWLLEALVTAAVLGYVGKVRPGLLFGGQGVRARVAHIGDEHGAR